MERNYWGIHMGQANKYANLAYEKKFIGIGWNELSDLGKYINNAKRDFLNEIKLSYYKNYHKNSPQDSGQIYRFVSLMQIGDIVLMPKTDEGKIYIGEIISDYYFENKFLQECPFQHRRGVKWIKVVGSSDISPEIKGSINTSLTVFNISKHAEEINNLLVDADLGPPDKELDFSPLEWQLEKFLIKNWGRLEISKDYEIFSDDGIGGEQYVTKIGKIDILAKSKNKKEWLVIELKRGRTSDDVVGQTLRYIGWIEENEAAKEEVVKGLIITKEIDEKLKFALLPVKNIIKVMTYSVDFKLDKLK